MASYTIKNGHQLRKDQTTPSTVFVNAAPTGGGACEVFYNTTSILSTGDFDATTIWTDGTGAGLGRFAPNPLGFTYCNGVESCVYSGDESPMAALFQLSVGATELITDSDNRDFAAASEWTNNDINAYDESGDLSITASAAGQYCYLPVANAPMTVGKAYRLGFTLALGSLVATWTIKDYAGTQTIGTVSSDNGGAAQFIDFVAETTGGLRIVAVANNSSADFDDFSLKELVPAEKTDEINNTLQTTGNYITWAAATTPAIMLLSDRPLQGIKVYVKSANASTATMYGKYYKNDATWAALSLTDNTAVTGKTLAQTGTVTFTSTVSDAAPFHYQGLYLYAYFFSISAGSGEVYYITVDAPFQEIKDIWDGAYRTPISYQYYNASKYEDYTYDVNYDSTIAVVVGAVIDGLVHTTDHIICSFAEQTVGILVSMLSGYVNTTASVLTVKYWNGSAWAAVSGQVDGTSNAGATHGQTGLISWLKPSSEVKHTLFNRPGYHYKFEFSATFSGTKAGDYEVVVNTVKGIPAQHTVRGFKYPAEYLGRTLLCGYTAGKEGNRIDYSMTDYPLAFNGEDSSRNNTQSIYVSGGDELMGSTTLTNRYGASIIGVHVVCKKTEMHILFGSGPDDFKVYPISYSIGLCAPLTLFTAEVAFGVGTGDEAKRNICGGLSYDGPWVFDGTVLIPLGGIRKYFDPADDEYINLDYVANSIMYFNTAEKVLNLLMPVGSSTTLNKWVCFDFMRPKKGWFEKVPPAYPQAAFPVVDTNGGRHIYGGLFSGYMIQLDYGTSWGGAAIDMVLETGDFGPSGNVFDKTTIDEIRAIAKGITEDVDLTIKHYADTEESSSTTIGTMALDGASVRLVRNSIKTNKTAWMHRLRFEASTDSTAKGLQLIGWAYKWTPATEDPRT